MRARSPQAPYVGLWSRLAGFVPDALSRLLVERRAVGVALMRSTIHFVAAERLLELSTARPGRAANDEEGAPNDKAEGMDREAVASRFEAEGSSAGSRARPVERARSQL